MLFIIDFADVVNFCFTYHSLQNLLARYFFVKKSFILCLDSKVAFVDAICLFQVEFELKRRWTMIFLSVYLPTTMLQLVGYTTLYVNISLMDVSL